MAKEELLFPVTKETDIVELLIIPRRRQMNLAKVVRDKTKEQHQIQDVWNKYLNHPVEVSLLVEKSALPFRRVREHVNQYINNRHGMARFVRHRQLKASRRASPLVSQERVTPSALSTPEAVDLAAPERVAVTVRRIIRDTDLARRVKELHSYKCQICGHTIRLPDGSFYAEAHHIQPLGQPHNGPDLIGNILCLCPNHHAELDLRVRRINVEEIVIVDGHKIDRAFVDYHNRTICEPADASMG